MLFIASAVFAFGCAYMIYVFGYLPGDTPQGTKAKIGALGGVRYSLFAALMAFVSGHAVQMISDIRWKLFDDKLKAERMTAFGSMTD
jgi:hypothetical protein